KPGEFGRRKAARTLQRVEGLRQLPVPGGIVAALVRDVLDRPTGDLYLARAGDGTSAHEAGMVKEADLVGGGVEAAVLAHDINGEPVTLELAVHGGGVVRLAALGDAAADLHLEFVSRLVGGQVLHLCFVAGNLAGWDLLSAAEARRAVVAAGDIAARRRVQRAAAPGRRVQCPAVAARGSVQCPAVAGSFGGATGDPQWGRLIENRASAADGRFLAARCLSGQHRVVLGNVLGNRARLRGLIRRRLLALGLGRRRLAELLLLPERHQFGEFCPLDDGAGLARNQRSREWLALAEA